jgi:hypothetical protein
MKRLIYRGKLREHCRASHTVLREILLQPVKSFSGNRVFDGKGLKLVEEIESESARVEPVVTTNPIASADCRQALPRALRRFAEGRDYSLYHFRVRWLDPLH